MSAYFEDLWELQHALDGTELDYYGTLEDEQHNDPNVSVEDEERRQRYQDREMRKLSVRHEIERWNERGWEPPAPKSGHQRGEDKSPHPDQPKGQAGSSSAPKDVEKQDARQLPSWARKILAVADQIELENETVKRHKIPGARLDRDGQGHQQYIATQQHLQDFQMGIHQQQPQDVPSDMHNGSQGDPHALHQQQNEQLEDVRSPASSNGSSETVVPWVEEHSSNEEDGPAKCLKNRTRRKGKGKVTNGDVATQEVVASNEIMDTKSGHEVAEREIMREIEIDQPKLDVVRHQEVAARASPAQREGKPPKAGQDPAQSKKLERKQQQKAATETRRKQRQEKRQEEKKQKMMEERRAEEKRREEDEGFWQWLRERQLANPNATVASLSKERYLKEARQQKEQEAREARRKKQREERAAASQDTKAYDQGDGDQKF